MRCVGLVLAMMLAGTGVARGAPLPDVIPWGVALDGDNRLQVTLVNQGDAPIPDTGASVDISIDGRVLGSYMLRRLSDRGFVAPGGRTTIATNFRLGGDLRRIGVRVDPGNVLAEANERQNMLTRALRPAALSGPDFRIADLYLTGAGALRVRIVNAGSVAAPVGTSVSVRVIVNERVAADFSADMGGIRPGAGRDATPATPITIKARARVRALVNTARFGDELDSTNNIREKTLPAPDLSAYDALLADPRIADSMVWDSNSGPRAYPAWTADQRTALRNALTARENNEDPGLSAPPTPLGDNQFSAADAWTLYVSHAAHALWLEKNRLVPWRIVDMPADQRAMLLASNNLVIQFFGSPNFGVDSHRAGSLIQWNPKITWDFLRVGGLVRSRHDDTLYGVTDWLHDNLIHIDTSMSARDIYAYEGLAPFDRVLYPLPGQMHVTIGCSGTAPLLVALMRAANIPAQFSTWPGSGAHRRTVFPSLGRTIVHADDVHSLTQLPTGAVPPASAIYRASTANFDSPTAVECGPTRCHSSQEQGFFNAARADMDNTVAVTGDYLLLDYARGGPDSLDRLLRSAGRDGVLDFARPLYADAERPPIIAAVESQLRTIGGGDIEAGKAIVIARANRFYDAIRRVAP